MTRYILVAAILALAPSASADPFYIGADLSLLPTIEQLSGKQSLGGPFLDNGLRTPAETILANHGANLFRLRLFVSPQTTYTNSNAGAIQTLAYDIALAQRLKASVPTARILLDFHYSDTWADPGKQTTPAAWAGQSLSQLQSTLRTYTADTLTAFKNAGVLPDMVQLGNEIQSGMLWETGKLVFSPAPISSQRTSWQNFGSLLRSAIQGVRDAQGPTGPAIDIAIHPGGYDVSPFFFSRLTDPTFGNVPASSFDTLGVSYYPDSAELASLQSTLTTLVQTYDKPTMVLETIAPWRSTNAPASDPTYPDTPQGQLSFLTDLRNTVASLPNHRGAGLVYWYPESLQVPGYNIYNGGSTSLFDSSGNALPALAAFPEPSLLLLTSILCLLTTSRRWSVSPR